MSNSLAVFIYVFCFSVGILAFAAGTAFGIVKGKSSSFLVSLLFVLGISFSFVAWMANELMVYKFGQDGVVRGIMLSENFLKNSEEIYPVKWEIILPDGNKFVSITSMNLREQKIKKYFLLRESFRENPHFVFAGNAREATAACEIEAPAN